MMTTNMISQAPNNDADLVAATMAGSRDAFTQIVSRYQSLICSLAYSATGSLGQSEDLAQETFITAWTHLGHLRERHKLRSWLCGIARNRINNFLRREGREPVRDAEPLENAVESQASEPLPVEHAISREEEQILWRSLEKIPQIYREPLILFYREHRSVEAVARELDLTAETVHQRLSRGRKLLQEQVLAFVEGALDRTNPGKTFTLGVLAALPIFASTSKAAVMGAAVVKGGAAVKGAGMVGFLGTILTPFLVVFGNYASYRMSIDEAHSDQERHEIRRMFLSALLIAVGLSAVVAVPLAWMCDAPHNRMLFWGILFSQCIVFYFLALLFFVLRTLPQRRRYLAQILAASYEGQFPESAFEYRSKFSLFGLPLIHVRLGDRFDVLRGPVKAWIAIGSSHAVGVLFASGGLAVAPLSIGGIAIGIIPFGAFALGIIPIGAIALGIWSFGGLAAGWQVCCGAGVAWNAISGGFAIAHDYAAGGLVWAINTNSSASYQFMQQHLFFRISQVVATHNFWLMVVGMTPMAVQSWITAKASRRRERATV
jgi:RNA polymerase sigma factor (sigma-70 family)